MNGGQYAHSAALGPETVWAPKKTCLEAVNLERARSVQQLLSGGFTGSSGVVTGTVRVASSIEEAERRLQPGDILVVANTTNLWERLLGLAAGVITDIGEVGSHTAIVIREQRKPTLVDAPSATVVLREYDNQTVTLDATQRMVFLGEVPPDWISTPGNLQPTYGTLDQETEEESWSEATLTGQTYLGADGRRWIGKPRHPVSRFMQEIYRSCHKWMGERLSIPVTAEIQDGIHRMDFHELFRWRLKVRTMTLEDLEQLHRERLSAVKAYLDASDSIELTPDALLRWIELFIRMNAFMALAYIIYYKATEGLLEHEMAGKRTPEPYYSQVRPSMCALIGETEATHELRGYKALLDEARDDDALRQEVQRVDEVDIVYRLRRAKPE